MHVLTLSGEMLLSMKFNVNYVLFLRTCYLSANSVCSFHSIFNLKMQLKFSNKFTVVMILNAS